MTEALLEVENLTKSFAVRRGFLGGSAGTVTTWVAGARGPAGAPGEDGVTASGPGAVGVGGDVTGPVSTHVTETDGQG